MKDLKLINTIAILIPVSLFIAGFINPLGFYLSIYSTILTGLLQIIIGIKFWLKFKNNISIKIYFFLVMVFFCLWYFNTNVNYIEALNWPLLSTPLILCIYISIILYSKK